MSNKHTFKIREVNFLIIELMTWYKNPKFSDCLIFRVKKNLGRWAAFLEGKMVGPCGCSVFHNLRYRTLCKWQTLNVAEHSFSAHFCWCNLAHAQGIQKTNMPSCLQESGHFIYSTPTLSVIFLYNCMRCVDGFSILLQRYVTKGNDAKSPAIFSFCLLPKEPS